MKSALIYAGMIAVTCSISGFCSDDVLKSVIAPSSLLITGVGIGTVWTLDLVSQKNITMNGSIFKARDKGTNQVMWPHLLAEYGTAASAIVSAIGLYRKEPWAEPMALVTSGLITYTSINSMAWVVSEKERFAYAIPMMIGLASAGITVAATF